MKHWIIVKNIYGKVTKKWLHIATVDLKPSLLSLANKVENIKINCQEVWGCLMLMYMTHTQYKLGNWKKDIKGDVCSLFPRVIQEWVGSSQRESLEDNWSRCPFCCLTSSCRLVKDYGIYNILFSLSMCPLIYRCEWLNESNNVGDQFQRFSSKDVDH